LLYGVNQLVLGTSFLLEGIESASLPNEFFTSAAMQRYRGSIAQARGREFEETVASTLREQGWRTLVSVQMASLGASPELGDVDVAAWHPEDSRLLLIECKRLQTARGVGEIVERLNQFRGDSADRLGRHLRRFEWIQANFPAVHRALRLPAAVEQPVAMLVVNADVPMQFQQGLPLPPKQILPLHRVAEQLVPRRH
jgi:Holliday junction resolvase